MGLRTLAAIVMAPLMAASCTSIGGNLPLIPGDEPQSQESRTNVEYTLGAGDALRVIVFGEPELSDDFVVDGAGLISIPLLGQTQAAGKTVPEFESTLADTLRERDILRAPQVSVEVTNYRPYYILGEVNRPGEYDYTSGLTVFNAVATAQGFTYRANRRRILVTHADAASEVQYQLTPETRVLPGDTIRIVECIIC